MQPISNILIVLALFTCVCIRRMNEVGAGTSAQLRWWQKLAGVVSLLCVVLIALNPEFWALGLLGDTAFFDLFVLVLSIQLQMTLAWAWGWFGASLSRGLRWIITPRPLRSCLLAAWAVGAAANRVYVGYLALRRVAARSGIRPFERNLCV